MVPIDFYRYRNQLRQALLARKESLANDWDPFVAAWVGYAFAVDGNENNQPLSELCDRLRGWLYSEDLWEYQRNLGPIAATLWLCREIEESLKVEIDKQLSEKIVSLTADEKWSPLRDGEQVFLLALGLGHAANEQAKSHLRDVAKRQYVKGPLRRRVLYSVALRELGEEVVSPQDDPQDEGDIIALVWWAERYGEDKYAQWQRFASIQERIAIEEILSGAGRALGVTEMAMLYEAIAKETQHPEPLLLLEYFPIHERIREVSRDYIKNGKYASAVFEATKALNEKIQECSGVMNKNEVELVQATMKKVSDPSSLPIKFNDYLNEDSGKNEQVGLASICEGIFKAFRNPKGHKPEGHKLVQLNAYEVLDQLVIISYMMKRIERSCHKNQ